MKNSQGVIVIFIASMLTACEARSLDIHRADAAIVDGQVCVKIDAGKREYLNLLQIIDSENEKEIFTRYFDADKETNPIQLTKNNCVPMLGYSFQAGHGYGVSVGTFTKSPQRYTGRNYSASFSLTRTVDGLALQ